MLCSVQNINSWSWDDTKNIPGIFVYNPKPSTILNIYIPSSLAFLSILHFFICNFIFLNLFITLLSFYLSFFICNFLFFSFYFSFFICSFFFYLNLFFSNLSFYLSFYIFNFFVCSSFLHLYSILLSFVLYF